MLRQRSRPYLFSNSLAPNICAASLKVFEMLNQSTELRDKLEKILTILEKACREQGFDVDNGDHPIVPIMLGDAIGTKNESRITETWCVCDWLLYPVVPQGKARIRTQLSAAHSFEDLDIAITAFSKAREAVS